MKMRRVDSDRLTRTALVCVRHYNPQQLVKGLYERSEVSVGMNVNADEKSGF